jgi:hypothetical protein
MCDIESSRHSRIKCLSPMWDAESSRCSPIKCLYCSFNVDPEKGRFWCVCGPLNVDPERAVFDAYVFHSRATLTRVIRALNTHSRDSRANTHSRDSRTNTLRARVFFLRSLRAAVARRDCRGGGDCCRHD